MKSYTIDQIRKYLQAQDSFGDAVYNLERIDEYVINTEITAIADEEELYEYLSELETHQGEKFSYGDDLYQVCSDVTSFIREYGSETVLGLDFSQLEKNGIIYEISPEL